MKKCPICDVDLVSVQYEGVRVMRCGSCKGYLVRLAGLERIKRVDIKTQEQLKSEASFEFSGSCPQHLKCPRCHLPMHRQAIDLPVLDLQYDICTQCSLIWLDRGELAIVQLAYQSSSGFINAQELKRRMQELEASPLRKAMFRENLANLPESKHPVEEVLGEAAEMLEGVLRVLITAPL